MRRRDSLLRRVLRASVILAAAAFLALNADLAGFAARFDRRLLVAVLCAQLFLLPGFVVLGWRLALLARRPAAPFVPCLKAILLAAGLNAALPARLSELLKPVFLRDHAGVPMSDGFAAVFLERLGDAVILGLLAASTIGLYLGGSSPWQLILVAAAAVVALSLLPRLEALLGRFAGRIPWASLRLFAGRFLAHTSARVKEGDLARAYLAGLGAWGLSLGAVAAFLVLAGDRPIGPAGVLMVFTATTIGGALPVLPAGFGTYEGAAAAALMTYGYELEEGLALGLGLHASQLATPVVASLIVLSLDRIGLGALVGELRAARRTAVEG